MTIPPFLAGKETIIVAHRGNSGEAPENTLAAFRSAAFNEIAYIEFDVHLTKDGVPVVVHDRQLTRLANHAACIDELTLEEAKQLDFGKWFHDSFKEEKIPALQEVLEAPLDNIGLMIEIKHGSAPDQELVSAVIKEIREYLSKNPERLILVGSLSANIVKLVKESAPELKIIGIADTFHSLNLHLQNEPDIIAANKKIITETSVRNIQNSGRLVWVWTVDSPEEIQQALKCNVDGIISNHPLKLKPLISS